MRTVDLQIIRLSDDRDIELAYQLKSRITHVFSSRNTTPASLSREVLTGAITAFPNNTSFLSMFATGEKGGRIHGRVQQMIAQTHSEQGTALATQFWVIWAEASLAYRTFWDQGGSGAERVRSALRKAISSTKYVTSAPSLTKAGNALPRCGNSASNLRS
jgi:hypothetical protein